MNDQYSSIVVKASASIADGVGAHFNLLVDGTVVGDATVVASQASEFAFKVVLDPSQPHTIAVQYDNDLVAGATDRNLFVQSLSVNGTVINATDPAMTYQPDYGLPVRTGTGDLYWGGTLSTIVPATASQPAATQANTRDATAGQVTTTPVVTIPVIATPVVTTPVVTIPVVTTPVVTTPVVTTTTASSAQGVLSITASGTSAGGINPHFQLLVDDAAVASLSVADGPEQTFDVPVTLDPGKPHRVSVVYDNDAMVGGVDRNLFVQSITVNGATFTPADGHSVYHANGPGDLKGTGALYWGGTLDFDVPASASATTTGTTTTGSSAAAASSGTTTAAAPVETAQPGFYVATFGSDGADGSATHPFATLDRARQAMEGSQVHTTYVLGGVYAPAATLVLGAADSGLRFIAASGGTPVLDGKARLSSLITLDGASGVTLQGLTFTNTVGQGTGALSLKNASGNSIVANSFENNANGIVLEGSDNNLVLNNAVNHSAQSAVEAKDGSDGNTFASNSIDGTGALAQSGGGFFLHGVNNNTITHNLVQNTAGVGIGIENWDNTTVNVGNTVTDNIVRNTSTRSEDSGAIYILGRSHVDTKALVANNLIDNTGAGGDAHTIGIYLDDSTSGVTVKNNVVTSIGTHAVEIHGGDNNVLTNNIFNLGAGAASAVLFQAAPADTNPTNTMLGNLVQNNVILASGTGQTAFTSLDGGHPTITANLYAGLTPAQVTSGLLGDSSPRFGSGGSVSASSGSYTLPTGGSAGGFSFTPIDTTAFGVQPLPASWAR